jgi:hypothetical protein
MSLSTKFVCLSAPEQREGEESPISPLLLLVFARHSGEARISVLAFVVARS